MENKQDGNGKWSQQRKKRAYLLILAITIFLCIMAFVACQIAECLGVNTNIKLPDFKTIFDFSQEESKLCEHQFKQTVVYPTCEKEGYTLRVCSICGFSYKSQYEPKLGHVYTRSKLEHGWGHTSEAYCAHCRKGDGVVTTYCNLSRESRSSNYYELEATIANATESKVLIFTKAIIYFFDEDGNCIHSEWTYAVDSNPLYPGQKRSYDTMVKASYIADAKSYSIIYDCD